MIQSIVRYLIVSLFAYLVGHGVITKDIADANVAAWTNYAVIGLTIAGGVAWSYLEKKYKGVLAAYLPTARVPDKTNLGPTSPALVGLLLPILALSAAASVLIGCASSSYIYTPANGGAPVTITGFDAWCENNLTTIRAATKSSVVIAAKEAFKQSATSTRVAGYVRSSEAVLQPLLNKVQVSSTDIDGALAKVKVNDPDGIFANAIEPAINLVAGYIVQLSADGVPEKVIIDVLTALINGLNDAALALDPATTSAN